MKQRSLKLCPSDPDKRSDILPELDEIDLAERFALRQPVVPDPSEPRTDAVDGRSQPKLRENPHHTGLQRDPGPVSAPPVALFDHLGIEAAAAQGDGGRHARDPAACDENAFKP